MSSSSSFKIGGDFGATITGTSALSVVGFIEMRRRPLLLLCRVVRGEHTKQQGGGEQRAPLHTHSSARQLKRFCLLDFLSRFGWCAAPLWDDDDAVAAGSCFFFSRAITFFFGISRRESPNEAGDTDKQNNFLQKNMEITKIDSHGGTAGARATQSAPGFPSQGVCGILCSQA